MQNGSATANSTLTVNPTAAPSSFSGVVQDGGTGTLAVAVGGTQSVTLSGASTYSGGTTVNAGGTLVVANTTGSATGTGPVQVDGTLAGSGTISGAVTFGGGTLAPDAGSSTPATLTLGSTTLADSSATVDYQLGVPGTVGGGVNDLTVVNGNLGLDGTLNVSALPGFGAGVYELFSYTGSLSGDLSLGSLPGGFNGLVDLSVPGIVNLDINAVPEPSTFVLAGFGIWALVFAFQRSRRAVRK